MMNKAINRKPSFSHFSETVEGLNLAVGQWHYACSDAATATFDPRLFNAEWLFNELKTNEVLRQGRGAITYFTHHDQALVLKQYRRGGVPARFSKASYLWTGLENTRAWREFELLKQMSVLGLAVPKPYACAVFRRGLSYQAYLITQKIEDAETLWATLLEKKLGSDTWRAIGRCIANFHNAGVFHADLNAANILLPIDGAAAALLKPALSEPVGGSTQSPVQLIDFDRGEFRSPKVQGWQQSNVSRLRRSLDKLCAHHNPETFDESDWQQFIQGYASSCSEAVS